MSKKHYDAIAATYAAIYAQLKRDYPVNTRERQHMLALFIDMVNETACVLAEFNERFDHDRFDRAIYGDE